PATRLIHDDACIGVKLVIALDRSGEQLLVDRVFALYSEDRYPVKAELFVDPDGLLVIMQDRKVHIGGAACLEVLRELSDEPLADARMARLRVHSKAPEGGPPLRVVKEPLVIDPGDGADNIACRLFLRDKI